MTHPLHIVTIGVYGFSESDFFNALSSAGVDLFCDIRARRGVRGSKYAFANSKRLQSKLDEMGIRYHHAKDLAPTAKVREVQKDADVQERVAKRKRTKLSPDFVRAFSDEVLGPFDAESFIDEHVNDAQVIALFCVERSPEACHRSLVAKVLSDEAGVEVANIEP